MNARKSSLPWDVENEGLDIVELGELPSPDVATSIETGGVGTLMVMPVGVSRLPLSSTALVSTEMAPELSGVQE